MNSHSVWHTSVYGGGGTLCLGGGGGGGGGEATYCVWVGGPHIVHGGGPYVIHSLCMGNHTRTLYSGNHHTGPIIYNT